MDSRGNIHYVANITGTEPPSSNVPPEPLTGPEALRRISRKLKPLALVEIPEYLLEKLQNAPRKVRIAWYSDYRRAQKRARKTGQSFEVPGL